MGIYMLSRPLRGKMQPSFPPSCVHTNAFSQVGVYETQRSQLARSIFVARLEGRVEQGQSGRAACSTNQKLHNLLVRGYELFWKARILSHP
jgi:hypothetical protein